MKDSHAFALRQIALDIILITGPKTMKFPWNSETNLMKDSELFKKAPLGNSLMVQWLELGAFPAEGSGLS